MSTLDNVPGASDTILPVQVIVDADACPRGAMAILRRLQREYGYRLVTVASFHHVIVAGATHADACGGDDSGAGDNRVEHVTVGDGPDEADLAVVNRARPDDIVVTQDWGLAALVLGKGAQCLSPSGHVYTPERIEFQLDERHTKAKHRRAGGRTRGPRARTAADDERFERTFRVLLEGQAPYT